MNDLSALLDVFQQLEPYQRLIQSIQDGHPPGSLNLPRAARTPALATLARDIEGPLVFVLNRNDQLLAFREELQTWSPELRIFTFSEPNPSFYEQAVWGPHTRQERIATLSYISSDRQPGGERTTTEPTPSVILTTAKAIITRTLALRHFIANSRWIKAGATMRMDRLLQLLVQTGYHAARLVTEPGEFSHRGGILDIWPPAENTPVRVDFFGDEIDTLRLFDPATQRSRNSISSYRLTPAREGLLRYYKEEWDSMLPAADNRSEIRASLFEFFLPMMNPVPGGLPGFLGQDALVVFDDQAGFNDTLHDLESEAVEMRQEKIRLGELSADYPIPYLTLSDLEESLSQLHRIDFGSLASHGDETILLDALFSPGPRLGGQLKHFTNHLLEQRAHHETVVIVSRQAPRLLDLWKDHEPGGIVLKGLPSPLAYGEIYFLQGALADGWTLHTSNNQTIHLLSDAEIFGWSRPRPRSRPRVKTHAPESAYADLHTGGFVVHIDFGISIYRGLVQKSIEGIKREYLEIEFAVGDRVYVPIHQADRISRYVGAESKPPALSRLGTQQWARTKSQARDSIQEIAQNLLELYAERMSVPGHAFSEDTPWQQELEGSFAYIETDDQIRALEEVKQDMERPRPMDRLICGDVGYGKTEVALRAAFKAVMGGRQVAILVPTTVLAQQHYNTFRQRLAAFPAMVEMLSRFRTTKQAERILAQTRKGEIDILIGTHRLLQDNLEFKDLGLLIIDEEQRFGVTHKEYLKRMRTEVDVLTLTATPIPRTLYFALTGVRDISNINTPPDERLPVITHVGEYDPRLVRQAIRRELERGGQIFFVHNRVQTIQAIYNQLQRLVPEARLAIGHGQMQESQLSDVMELFTRHEIDVLVCTSIIESGLDIPNANTIIVDRADLFGLSQLYQLRGRVGRGAVRAYAYFFRHPKFRPTDEGSMRLETIAEHSHLGAGYNIAMRDLEMRGAGDILGFRQHGHITSIGFHLYTRMLSNAVRHLKEHLDPNLAPPVIEIPISEPLPVTIDLHLPGSIPPEYITDRDLRLHLYRRMAEMRDTAAVLQMKDELADRFGAVPEEIDDLIYQLELKILAYAAQIQKITSRENRLSIELNPFWIKRDIPPSQLQFRRRKLNIYASIAADSSWPDQLKQLLISMNKKVASHHTGD